MPRAKPAAPPPAAPRALPPPDARRLGALTLGTLLLLALPGVLLALRYAPDPALAHDAVARLDAGPLRVARGAHAWASALALALVALHLARAYAAGRMRAPGRGATLAGVGALAVLLGAYFTGTVLPWDQQGWEALQHLRAGAGVVGANVAEGAPADAPLRALFLAHVLAVPALLALLLLFHVRRGAPRADATRLGALLRASWRPLAAAAAGVALLALLLPPALGPAPIEGLSITKPDWPFLWLVPLQDAFGAAGLWALPLALAAMAALVVAKPPPPRARLVLLAAAGAAWLALTLLGART